jgi:hypothetical protein
LLSDDKLRERALLLKRFLYHLEWDWPNDVKTKVLAFLGRRPEEYLSFEELARSLSDSQLERLIWMSPVKDYYTFRGKYYTVRKGGVFESHGSWDEVKSSVSQILRVHGKKGYALLKALTEVKEAPFEFIAAKASEIYGDRIYPSHLIAELRDRWDLAWEVGTRQYPRWAMPEEVKPAVIEAFSDAI